MQAIKSFVAKARTNPKKLVLPEGQDPRVVAAANRIIADRVAAEVIVLGTEAEISESCRQAGIRERAFLTLDHLAADNFESLATQFAEIRKKKGITLEQASAAISDRVFFGSLMTRNGITDGLVAGSIASTPDMLRAAFNCIGTAPGINIASSCFVMDLATPAPAGDSVLLYADCGVNPDPTAEQLVDIALATAQTYRSLVGTQPKVAFLSFSTAGSATHPALEKITAAASLMKMRIKNEKLDIVAEGELQADAALVPTVAKSKAPHSAIVGDLIRGGVFQTEEPRLHFFHEARPQTQWQL